MGDFCKVHLLCLAIKSELNIRPSFAINGFNSFEFTVALTASLSHVGCRVRNAGVGSQQTSADSVKVNCLLLLGWLVRLFIGLLVCLCVALLL